MSLRCFASFAVSSSRLYSGPYGAGNDGGTPQAMQNARRRRKRGAGVPAFLNTRGGTLIVGTPSKQESVKRCAPLYFSVLPGSLAPFPSKKGVCRFGSVLPGSSSPFPSKKVLAKQLVFAFRGHARTHVLPDTPPHRCEGRPSPARLEPPCHPRASPPTVTLCRAILLFAVFASAADRYLPLPLCVAAHPTLRP